MPAWKNVVAVIFDFDDTLTEDSTSALLTRYGKNITPDDFWKKEVDPLVRNEGWEPTNAWIHLLIKFMKDGRLKSLTNRDLREFGESLEPFSGLSELFRDLKDFAKKSW